MFKFDQTKITRRKFYVRMSTANFKRLLEMCFGPIWWNKKSVPVSNKRIFNFHVSKKCQTSCHVLKFPFKKQKPTLIFVGGVGAYCFARKNESQLRDTISFLENILRHMKFPADDDESKWDKIIQYRVKTRWDPLGWGNELDVIFDSFQTIWIYIQATWFSEVQRRNRVISRLWSGFGYSDCERSFR